MDFESIKNAGAKFAKKAANGAETLVNKGKTQISKANLEAQQASVQRKLGALVYTISKNGGDSGDMVQKYISQLEVIESQLAALNGGEDKTAVKTVVCGECGAQNSEGAVFCSGCGHKLG